MARVPTGFVNQTELHRQFLKAARKLGPDVVHINYSLGEDWTGEPSINFRVVLTNEASNPERLLGVANRVKKALRDKLQPEDNWGLNSYFSFRSKAEQDELNDPVWAA
jgi:hypothetical protein